MTAPLWQNKNEKNHTVKRALSTDMTDNILSSTSTSPKEENSRSSSAVDIQSGTVINTPDNASNTRKRLACTNCRNRRKKCDLGFPCGNCSRLELVCNVNDEDLRKKRYTNKYVKSLESHIAQLETNLKNLVQKIYPDDDRMLNRMMVGDVMSVFPDNSQMPDEYSDQTSPLPIPATRGTFIIDNDKANQTPKSFKKPTPTSTINSGIFDSQKQDFANSLNGRLLLPRSITPQGEKRKMPLVKGSLYPEGPVSYKRKPLSTPDGLLSASSLVTSVDSATFPDGITGNNSTLANGGLKKRISDLKTTVIVRGLNDDNPNSINNDPRILKSLSNFYKWLYPGYFIFVHRESFLYGFFNHSKNNYEDSNYCSVELIYAVCAVGSRLTPDLHEYSEIYYERSKKTLLQLVFDEQSTARITTVQALFCLAFYELGKGNNQLGWYFSGLAIRVGYDMGFQLDPKVWYIDDSNLQLTQSELEIRSRIYWGCYIADHFICLMLGRTSTLSVSNSTMPDSDELPEVNGTEEFRFIGRHVLQISLPLKNLIILSRLVQIFTSKIFIESEDIPQKVKYLNTFNSQVYNWRQSLPEFLQWSKTLIEDDDVSTDPTISYFWYYYYIVRLTFNKPFIEDSQESETVVIEIIDDLKTLLDNFGKKFGNYTKGNLYQIYACLLAINCLKKLKETRSSEQDTWDAQLEFFNHIFYTQLSPSYELPKRLQEDTELETEQENQTLNQVGNINYTHDFSLSHEIDDLIRELFGVGTPQKL
ncbi:hypothetical protein SUVZ_08G3540 [Saccharomyces uvarum]|uniref:Zn(2)-C6 fungal-type domain-containing protein n=1 Tax=Saccharomyces uvarum TaxID=230603 RepID=A0ABN8X115_SACUV|nr:hypothetical protein SUVZ_08G3540 [Saccharomyces uvarum]